MHKSRIVARTCLCSLLLIASASAPSAQEPNGSAPSTVAPCVSLRTGMGATLGAILGTFVFPGLGTGVGFLLGGGSACIYDGVSSA